MKLPGKFLVKAVIIGFHAPFRRWRCLILRWMQMENPSFHFLPEMHRYLVKDTWYKRHGLEAVREPELSQGKAAGPDAAFQNTGMRRMESLRPMPWGRRPQIITGFWRIPQEPQAGIEGNVRASRHPAPDRG